METTRTGNGVGSQMHALADANAVTKDLVIDPPIEWSDGKTYEVLHLQEPTGKQMEMAESELKAETNIYTLRRYQIALISHASKTPKGVIENMRISQIEEASSFLQRFTRGGRETGET